MPWWRPTTTDQLAALLHEVLANQVTILANQAKGAKVMSQISDQVAALQAQVAQETTVNQSAVTLLQGLKSQLDAALANAADDAAAVAAIQAISAQIGTDTTSLAAAVTQNTPAAKTSP